eukprot:Skav206555  [mRNA]  locus=scaffold925:29375:32052:- [translate_table: standard]
MFFTGDDVIQTAIADVVGPAVSAHNPEAAAAEHVFQLIEFLDLGMCTFLLLQQRHKLLHDAVIQAAALGQQKIVHLLLAHHRELFQGGTKIIRHFHGLITEGILHLEGQIVATLLEGLAHAETELCVVFEEGVGPGRALTLAVRGVGEGWVGATPNG